MEVLTLTDKQEKAIAELKRAMAKCYKLKIGFFNVLDTTYAFDRAKIVQMDVDANHEFSCMEYGYPYTSFSTLGGCSFADDQNMHTMLLTKRGRKLFNEDL